MQPLLRVRGLELAALRNRRSAPIVRDLSFEVGEGEAVALVGESGPTSIDRGSRYPASPAGL